MLFTDSKMIKELNFNLKFEYYKIAQLKKQNYLRAIIKFICKKNLL